MSSERPAPDPTAAHLAELIQRCARKDQAAFAELYDLTARRLHGVAIRILRSPEHAAEVTQEVYLEIWRKAPEYAPTKGSVVAWMSTMVHRRAVDRVRSVSSEVARDERHALFDNQREVDEVWDSVAQSYDVERVRSALATLTPIQLQVLQLAYFDGLSISQIAQLLKLPVGTVKVRRHRALKALTKELNRLEI